MTRKTASAASSGRLRPTQLSRWSRLEATFASGVAYARVNDDIGQIHDHVGDHVGHRDQEGGADDGCELGPQDGIENVHTETGEGEDDFDEKGAAQQSADQ